MPSAEFVVPEVEPARVTADRGGYLQTVSEDALFHLAGRHALVIRMEQELCSYVLPGAVLASIWPGDTLDDGVVRSVRRALVLGEERSVDQDFEFSLTQLVDIAVKALSPGINDATTAKACVDRLAEILVVLSSRALPEPARRGDKGRVLFVARRTSDARIVGLAFGDIRHFGAGVASVASSVLECLGSVAELVPSKRRPALARQASLMLEAARHRIGDADDLALVERAATWTGVARRGLVRVDAQGPSERRAH